MKILYLEKSEWEIDYIVSDIFENKVEVEFFSATNITRFLGRNDLVNNCVFCVNHSIDYDIVIAIPNGCPCLSIRVSCSETITTLHIITPPIHLSSRLDM